MSFGAFGRGRRHVPMLKAKRKDPFRGSARDRGYSTAWDRLSKAHRRRNPLCEMCRQDGLTVIGEDCDHIVPIEMGGDVMDPENIWTICRRHHNGLKKRLQDHAERTGQVDKLREWCLSPETRPLR